MLNTEWQKMLDFYQDCLQWRPAPYSSVETRSVQSNTETHNPVKDTHSSSLQASEGVWDVRDYRKNSLIHQNSCRRCEISEFFSQLRRCGVQTRLRPLLLKNIHQIHPRTFMWRQTHDSMKIRPLNNSQLITDGKLLHLITVLYSQLGQYSSESYL